MADDASAATPHAFWSLGKLWVLLFILVLLDLWGSILLYHSYPRFRAFFIKEDSVVENITALLFLLAFIVGLIGIVRLYRSPMVVILYLAIPMLGLAGFLDELSWGERISRRHAPVYIEDGIKIDGLHDTLLLFERWLKASLLPYSETLAKYNFLLTLFLAWTSCTLLALSLRKKFSALLFLSPALLFMLIAFFLDCREKLRFRLWKLDLRMFSEEMLELNGALCVLFAALAILLHQGVSSKTQPLKNPGDGIVDFFKRIIRNAVGRHDVDHVPERT